MEIITDIPNYITKLTGICKVSANIPKLEEHSMHSVCSKAPIWDFRGRIKVSIIKRQMPIFRKIDLNGQRSNTIEVCDIHLRNKINMIFPVPQYPTISGYDPSNCQKNAWEKLLNESQFMFLLILASTSFFCLFIFPEVYDDI